MADFCSCGSIMISGHCTNKNCSNRMHGKVPSASKSVSRKTAGAGQKEQKPTRTRRSSKCITYNLFDKKEEEENID